MIHELTDRCICIEIPKEVSFEGNGYNQIYTGSGEYEFHSLPYSELPPVKTGIKVSDWQILGRPNELSEEQWNEVVEHKFNHTLFENYLLGRNVACDTATESGQFLLKSKNVNPDNVIILIKQ